MRLAIERQQEKYSSTIFMKPELIVNTTSMMEQNDIEVLIVNMDNISITSIYKPPGEQFAFMSPGNLEHNKAYMIIGDFNGHNVTWHYSKNDENGELVEMWAKTYHQTAWLKPTLVLK